MLRYYDKELSLAYNRDRCIGCGRCVEVCPHGVFAMDPPETGGRVSVVARSHCMECGACDWNCPADALNVRRGVGCAYALFGQWANALLGGGNSAKGEPSCDRKQSE